MCTVPFRPGAGDLAIWLAVAKKVRSCNRPPRRGARRMTSIGAAKGSSIISQTS